jgi:hypothetical protein
MLVEEFVQPGVHPGVEVAALLAEEGGEGVEVVGDKARVGAGVGERVDVPVAVVEAAGDVLVVEEKSDAGVEGQGGVLAGPPGVPSATRRSRR